MSFRLDWKKETNCILIVSLGKRVWKDDFWLREEAVYVLWFKLGPQLYCEFFLWWWQQFCQWQRLVYWGLFFSMFSCWGQMFFSSVSWLSVIVLSNIITTVVVLIKLKQIMKNWYCIMASKIKVSLLFRVVLSIKKRTHLKASNEVLKLQLILLLI